MHWDNTGVPCCSAAVKNFVQRTIPLGKLRHAREALPQRLEIIQVRGEIAHQLFTLEKGHDTHARLTRVAVRNRSV
jgi:hypothetical protein